MRSRTRAFTLVELLVVIGIIALLISILLPSLQAARKAANTVKCAACLKEIGNAMMMYVGDNKGWACPLRCAGNGNNYQISYANYNPPITTALANQYWYCFLAKYVTRTLQGQVVTGNTGNDRQFAQQNNVIWGCPEWQPYIDTAFTGNTNPNDPGYGFNGFPEYTSAYPANGFTIGDASFTIDVDNHAVSTIQAGGATHADWGNPKPPVNTPPYKNGGGKWYRFTQYSHPAERALVGDCNWYFMESTPGTIPLPGQHVYTDQAVWVGDGTRAETQLDCYRHGRLPPLQTGTTTGFYQPNGGKVAYNVLFCDGHVSTLTDRESAFRVTRMRFPG